MLASGCGVLRASSLRNFWVAGLGMAHKVLKFMLALLKVRNLLLSMGDDNF